VSVALASLEPAFRLSMKAFTASLWSAVVVSDQACGLWSRAVESSNSRRLVEIVLHVAQRESGAFGHGFGQSERPRPAICVRHTRFDEADRLAARGATFSS